MTTYNFQQYWGYANANVACTQCGKVSKRRIREYCTVNPYNKGENGLPKQATEVQSDAITAAKREAERQVKAGRICRLCERVPA